MTIDLTTETFEQTVSAEGTGVATCEFAGAPDELQVSGDHNLRINLLPPIDGAPPDVDQRAFVLVSITVGDRWPDGVIARRDNIDLWLSVGGVADGATETNLAAADASTLEISWTREGGSARFAGLVDATTGAPASAPLAGLAGTITWTCGPALATAPGGERPAGTPIVDAVALVVAQPAGRAGSRSYRRRDHR